MRSRTYRDHDTRLDRVLWGPIVSVLCWISEHLNRNIYN